MGNNMSRINSQSIKSPEGVALLMENLWLRHKTGMKQRANNVFMVELPPLTKEEKSSISHSIIDDVVAEDDENFYGGWI